MRKIWEQEKRNAAPVAAILSHWNYKAKSSGGFQAIASMKRFGLLDEQGGGDKRSLKLSTLALDLLKNETTNPSEFLCLLKTAALKPKFHAELWNLYGTEMPSDKTIESFLVFDKHFTEEAAKSFLREYKDTISYAKLQSGDTAKEAGEEQEANEEQTKPQHGHTEKHKNTSSSHIISKNNPPASPPVTANLRYLPIPLDIGDAAIPVGMSEEDFDLLIETLQLWKKKIVRQSIESVIDVSQFDLTAEGDYILPSFFEGDYDYRDLREQTHVWSIGKRKADGTILASKTGKFYNNPEFECLWLR